MLTFEIGFSDSRGRKLPALDVSRGYVCSPSAPIQDLKGCGFAEISAANNNARINEIAPAASSRMLTFEIGSQTRAAPAAAKRFRPFPPTNDIKAVLKHESARGKDIGFAGISVNQDKAM